MPNNWGGKRPGAGRKPGPARPLDQLIVDALTPEDWLELLKHLHDLALGFGPDSRHAAALLMRYRFGGPAEPADPVTPDNRKTDPGAKQPAAPAPLSSPQPAALVLDLLKRYVSQASTLNNLDSNQDAEMPVIPE